MHLAISLHCLCKDMRSDVANTGSLFLGHFKDQDGWTDHHYNPHALTWYRQFAWGPWVEYDLRDATPSPFNQTISPWQLRGESHLGMGYFFGGNLVDFPSLVNHVFEQGFYMGSMTILQALVDHHSQWAMRAGIMTNPLLVGYVSIHDSCACDSAHTMEVTYGEDLPGEPSHAGYIILQDHHFRWVPSLDGNHVWLEAVECHTPSSFDPEHLRVGSRWGVKPDGGRFAKWEEHEVDGVTVGFTSGKHTGGRSREDRSMTGSTEADLSVTPHSDLSLRPDSEVVGGVCGCTPCLSGWSLLCMPGRRLPHHFISHSACVVWVFKFMLCCVVVCQTCFVVLSDGCAFY
jgi:hypothetical protein